MRQKTKENALLTFAICSAVLSFFLIPQNGFIYPRDRIVHIIFSLCINLFLVYCIKWIDFQKGVFAVISAGFIIIKIIYICIKFSNYFLPFQGTNSIAILLFSMVLIIITLKLQENNIVQIYSFFLIINLITIIMFIALSIKEINVINLYSTSLEVLFNPKKLIVFDEIFIISMLVRDDKKRIKYQKKFLFLLAIIIIGFTLLQGFCIGGNVLYSISPLQSLIQVFTSKTVKRFDYIIAVQQAINYFATIIFLMWAGIKILDNKGADKVENN